MGQETLWTNLGGLLSCISAFPSVHVAIACVAALYLRERFRPFRLIGDAFVAMILLISVYSGYHYLLDGVASLVIVLALNAGLVRHANRRGPLPSTAVIAPDSGKAGLEGTT
jgi:membrane-associated phospholipid phosphatase